MTSPVAIGGIGGSGTRLVAEIVRNLGCHLGGDLNHALDNLWFTLLFKRVELWSAPVGSEDVGRAVNVFRAAMTGGPPLTPAQVSWVHALAESDRPQHDRAWLRQRAGSLIAAAAGGTPHQRPWGWKEPNTHVFLDRLAAAVPGLAYIHVVRNGLDMAYSTNDNQLRLWGPMLMGERAAAPGPRGMLEYWCLVQRRAAQIGAAMPGRFLMLNYDAFCRAPDDHLPALGRLLGVAIDPSSAAALRSLVRVPGSIGRFKPHGLAHFDPADVEYGRESGFDTICDS
jgi:hypothetical protein